MGAIVGTKMNVGFLVPVFVSLAIGLLLAWIDTRPNWDDTGIEVGMILCSSICLGFAHPRNAWLWATLIGIWIPVADLYLHNNVGSSVSLIIAFAGAYGGGMVRKMFRTFAA